MDSNLKSQSPDSADGKPSFRKPLNDAANRKYRRRSPVSKSASSSSGSPNHSRSPSPSFSREDPIKISDDPRRRETGGRDLEMESGRSKSDKGGDSYRHSYKTSRDYRRHDDYGRYSRHSDGGERSYQRGSGRDSRTGTRSDRTRQESEYDRSREYWQNADRYTRDKPDDEGHRHRDKERETMILERKKDKEKVFSSDRHNRDRGARDDTRNYRKSSGDYKNDHSTSFEESRGHGKYSTTGRDSSANRLKDTHKSRHDDRESDKHKERYNRVSDGKDYSTSSHKASHVNGDNESSAKKPKVFNANEGIGNVKNGQFISKFTSAADEGPHSSSMQSQEIADKVIPEPAQSSTSQAEAAHDLDAAKIAAMKAAELVNRNLIGGGYMSTDQKKKLLWGNKKNTAVEESGHHWEMPLFSDRERQEKFNKLMKLRLPWYLWPNVGCQRRFETRAQTRRQRWQWPPTGREAAGASAGFREAIYCRAPEKRWPHCRTWSVKIIYVSHPVLTRMSDNSFFHPLCKILDCVILLFRSNLLEKDLSLVRTFVKENHQVQGPCHFFRIHHVESIEFLGPDDNTN